MQILVDADACPKVVKDILFRVSTRLKIPTILFANQPMWIAPSPFIRFTQVSGGFDVADDKIVEEAQIGDLAITADIPLAARIIEKGAHALNPRGEFYTPDNIRERVSIRNFMEELRGTGQLTGGPPPLNKMDQQKFANALDRFLAQRIKK